MNIYEYTGAITLHGNKELDDSVANVFCNSKSTSGRKGKVLSTWLEGYIYAACLGIVKNRREKLTDKVVKKNVWGPQWQKHLNFLLSFLLTKSDILVELNLLSTKKEEKAHKKETKKILTTKILAEYTVDGNFDQNKFYQNTYIQLSEILDSYMNGGLHVIKEELENDNFNLKDTDELIRLIRDENP